VELLCYKNVVLSGDLVAAYWHEPHTGPDGKELWREVTLTMRVHAREASDPGLDVTGGGSE